MQQREVEIPIDGEVLEASWTLPARARGVVAFAHGSGSSRHSPRNRLVAHALQVAGFATLLGDLLTAEEARVDEQDASLRFDIALLGARVCATIAHVRSTLAPELPLGLFGASTGAAAALVAAAAMPDAVAAVVSRGGRPDLAQHVLRTVRCPVLLLVGQRDEEVLALHAAPLRALESAELLVIPGATHLFPEPGALEQVAEAACTFFRAHLGGPAQDDG